jgi:bacterioferritin-associated ferredoxin
MYVCLCRAVTDRQVRHAVRAGACSIADVMECTRAGTCCGGCHATIEEIIDEEQSTSTAGERRSLPVLAPDMVCA